MVIDSLKNFADYAGLNPHFGKVIEFLGATDLATLEPGKYSIDGENVWANIVKGQLKKEADARMEAHDKYLDIQICISGKETFGWIQRAACTNPAGEYNPEKDIIFFGDKATTFFTLHDGEFTILFPKDGHQPMIGEGDIHKCIFKVRV